MGGLFKKGLDLTKKTVGVFINDEVPPYKCKICKKWTKHKSKAKNVCKKCYDKLE